MLALPLVLAIAIPLYFSGTPTLRAKPETPEGVAQEETARATQSDPKTTSMGTVIPTVEHNAVSPTAAVTYAPAAVAEIDALLAEREGVYGLVVTNVATGERYSRNADVPFLAASLYKLVLLADVFAAIDAGVIAVDTELTLLPEFFPGPDEPADSFFDLASAGSAVPIADALYATGAYSSNVAAYALLALTDDAQLEAMARRLGMNHTHFHVDPVEMDGWPPADLGEADPSALAEAVAFAETQALDGPVMLTTARDIEIFFAALLAGEVINPEVSAQILEILSEQAVDNRFPCLLPAGTAMAHKTGNLDHVVHDAGIIWTLTGPIILVAMIEDSPDDAEATLVIQRLAAIAFGLQRVPTIADALNTPEISCGVVAPVESETAEEVAASDLDEGASDAGETETELAEPDPAGAEGIEPDSSEEPAG